jgi:hypothetical protein
LFRLHGRLEELKEETRRIAGKTGKNIEIMAVLLPSKGELAYLCFIKPRISNLFLATNKYTLSFGISDLPAGHLALPACLA